MKGKLQISNDLSLPLEVASQAVAILGIRGSGKTNTAGVMAEELLDLNSPVVIIDPTNAWWGLRSGYPVLIFGGSHGDLPLQETDGKQIAEFQVQEQVPFILSLRHLRKGAQRRFVTEFCEELYHLKGKDQYRSPLTVFIDEAPVFIPQKVQNAKGEWPVSRTVGAVEDLIARGRNSGFGVVLVSQRSATLNKDVLTQADTIVAHRLTSPQDRKALSEWIEENATIERQKEVLSSLATMKNGQAWVWAPRLDVMKNVQVRMRHTFDSSASPKMGETIKPPKDLKEVDLDKLKGKLSASIEKARQDDPATLKKRIAELEREAKQKPTMAAAPAAKEKRVEVPVVKDAQIQRMEWLAEKLETLAGAKTEALEEWFRKLSELRAGVAADVAAIRTAIVAAKGGPLPQTPTLSTISRPIRPPPAPRQFVHRAPRPAGEASTNGTLGKGEVAVLKAIAQYPEGAERDQLTVLTGYKRSSRDTYIQRLRGMEYVEEQGGRIFATDAGVAALGSSYEPLPTGDALRDYWLNRLGGGEHDILEVLIANYPNAVPREKIDEQTGYKRSSRDTYIQRLGSRRLVDSVGRGEVKASDVLFG